MVRSLKESSREYRSEVRDLRLQDYEGSTVQNLRCNCTPNTLQCRTKVQVLIEMQKVAGVRIPAR